MLTIHLSEKSELFLKNSSYETILSGLKLGVVYRPYQFDHINNLVCVQKDGPFVDINWFGLVRPKFYQMEGTIIVSGEVLFTKPLTKLRGGIFHEGKQFNVIRKFFSINKYGYRDHAYFVCEVGNV